MPGVNCPTNSRAWRAGDQLRANRIARPHALHSRATPHRARRSARRGNHDVPGAHPVADEPLLSVAALETTGVSRRPRPGPPAPWPVIISSIF